MWVLYHNEDNYAALKSISQEIEAKNGEVLLMQCEFPNHEHEERVIGFFNNARDEEYQEFIDKCEDFFKELEKEIAIEKFTFVYCFIKEGLGILKSYKLWLLCLVYLP